MINQAIAKINTEMQKNSTDLYTEIIGQYVIDRITDAGIAEKILQSDKSLQKAMEAVTAKARSGMRCKPLAWRQRSDGHPRRSRRPVIRIYPNRTKLLCM